jgi:hypothetical protein
MHRIQPMNVMLPAVQTQKVTFGLLKRQTAAIHHVVVQDNAGIFQFKCVIIARLICGLDSACLIHLGTRGLIVADLATAETAGTELASHQILHHAAQAMLTHLTIIKALLRSCQCRQFVIDDLTTATSGLVRGRSNEVWEYTNIKPEVGLVVYTYFTVTCCQCRLRTTPSAQQVLITAVNGGT